MKCVPFVFDEKQLRLSKRIKLSKEEKEKLALERAFKYVQNLKAQGFDEKTVRVLHVMAERVAFLCEKHPSVKGNYRLLWFYYQKEFEKKTGDFKVDLVEGTSPETVSRAYRKLREHGFYSESLERVGLRSERANVFKRVYGGKEE